MSDLKHKTCDTNVVGRMYTYIKTKLPQKRELDDAKKCARSLVRSHGSMCVQIPDDSYLSIMASIQSSPRKGMAKSIVLALGDNMPHDMTRASWTIKDFSTVQLVGRYDVWSEFTALCNKSARRVTLKIFRESRALSSIDQKLVHRELLILSTLDSHCNILQFYCAFIEHGHVIFVSEFFNSVSLRTYLEMASSGRFPEAMAKKVVSQIVHGLSVLHSHGICHRSLNIDSILMDEYGSVKIANFEHSINSKIEVPMTPCGEVEIMAPEILNNSSLSPEQETSNLFLKNLMNESNHCVGKDYDSKVDVWAVGVICYEMLFGMTPVFSDNDVLIPIMPGKFVSITAKYFMHACFNRCPHLRPDVTQLKASTWLDTN